MANTITQNKALEYLDANIGKRRFIYWLGGVRSGKSYGATMCFIDHAFETGGDKLYMILGYTSPQILTIYSNYFQEICKQESLECEISRCTFDPHILVSGETDDGEKVTAKFLCRGADCDNKASAIQGLTLHGLLADEVANLNRNTLHQAEARISEDGALRVFTSNKTSPYHWTVKYYEERIREGVIPGLVLDAETRENKNVSNEYLKEREQEYTGDTLKRFIQNNYTLDAEPLYRIPVTTSEEILPEHNLFLYSHPNGVESMALAFDSNNHRYVIVAGRSYGIGEPFNIGNPDVTSIWLNSGNPLKSNELKAAGFRVRTYADGFYDWKLKALQTAIERNHLAISDTATNLIEAIQLYSRPRFSQFPIINCVEGTADLLKRHFRLRTVFPAGKTD